MIYLYNTLTRKKEEFKAIKRGQVGLYTCGPTVYNYAHLGNLRSYLFEDILKRVLLYNRYKVKHVMNITDVGHLTGDRDMGEDKLEIGAKREGKTAWQIAEFYTQAFRDDIKKLNILEPDVWCKATDYIKEQIDLIKVLEKKGYTYKTSDGIYYDTSKFKNYNQLSHLPLAELKEGARVEKNPEKKNSTDFALWKFSTPHPSPLLGKEREKKGKRQMEWDSPWGVGFPGWHLECSAMSLALLKNQLDIHCGGIDHINIHHTNEIAQSEAATGKKFFNFWLHGAFLNIPGGKKMAKSEDNFLTLENAIIKSGYHPLAFRYASLTVHYRKPMEWSEEAKDNAQCSLNHLNAQLRELHERTQHYKESDNNINKEFKEKFIKVINDDLNMPQALAIVQELLKSDLPNEEKLDTILDFNKVLGLDLKDRMKRRIKNELVDRLINQREIARKGKNWEKSDKLRVEIEKLGYTVEDTEGGQRVYKK